LLVIKFLFLVAKWRCGRERVGQLLEISSLILASQKMFFFLVGEGSFKNTKFATENLLFWGIKGQHWISEHLLVSEICRFLLE